METSSYDAAQSQVRRKSIANRVRDKIAYSLDLHFNADRHIARAVDRDRATSSQLARSSTPTRVKEHLLVPTVGKGNIGDQAMLEAFLLNTTAPVTLLVQYDDAHEVPSTAKDRVTKVVLADLYATRPWVRRKVRRTVASLIASHSTLSVIGADVMDGAYDAAESAFRFGMLCMANELGTPNRVLGFSWNGAPPEVVDRALALSQPQSLLCPRDPHSLARLRVSGDYNIVQAADMVFTMRDVEQYSEIVPWLRQQSGRAVVIMNVSGILARKGLEPDEYVDIANHLIKRGCSIVVLPHVIRAGDDDLAACTAFMEQLDTTQHVQLVDSLLTPRQVAWLASHATAVLTGRMHLSILSLNQGVPSAILTTQGKISGLMEWLGTPELLLEPKSGFAKAAINALNLILDDPSIAARLSDYLPTLRELAHVNFAGLEEKPDDVPADH